MGSGGVILDKSNPGRKGTIFDQHQVESGPPHDTLDVDIFREHAKLTKLPQGGKVLKKKGYQKE